MLLKNNDIALDGLLLVDKPGLEPESGVARHFENIPPTSHDVVQRVRRCTGQRRIGHSGTLDPLASGLLVLCLGWATRLVEYYQGHDKVYRAEVTFGWATDTLDALGTVVERSVVPPLDSDRIESALAGFRGPIMQRPPAFSALKQGGESLHYKARRGEAVEVDARPVTFHHIDLVSFQPPDRITIDVRCSAGAYIRSLADDLGRALGTVATLTALRRTGAGLFLVDQAHTLGAIEAASEDAGLADMVLPPGAGLNLPVVRVESEHARRLGFGQNVRIDDLPMLPNGVSLAMCQDSAGALIGIVRCFAPQAPADGPALWKAEKWFA